MTDQPEALVFAFDTGAPAMRVEGGYWLLLNQPPGA